MIRRYPLILCRIAVIALCSVVCFSTVLAEDADFIWAAYNGFALFEADGKLGLMTNMGEIVVPADYDEIIRADMEEFGNDKGEYGFGRAVKDGKMAIISPGNRLTTDNLFDILWNDDYYVSCWPQRAENGIYYGIYIENGMYGAFNTLGERLTEPIFEPDDFGHPGFKGFENGISPVHTKDGWGILNARGEIVASSKYWWEVEVLPNGYCVVQSDQQLGLISPEGKTILESEYIDIIEYGEGLVYVEQFRDYGDLHGYVNMEGELVIPFGDEIYSGCAFSNGLAVVRTKGGYGVINRLGEFVIAPEWDQIDREAFDNGEYLQVMKDEQYGIMDVSGKLISEPQWDEIAFRVERDSYSTSRQPDEGLYPIEYFQVRKNDVWGLLYLDGNVLSEPQWRDIGVFVNGAAVVTTPEGKYGFIDRNGRMIGEARWYSCDNFNDGLASVRRTDYDNEEAWYTFLSLDGAVLDQEWESARSFSDGAARVLENGLWGLIDTTGALIAPCQYDEINPSHEGLSRVKKDGLYGFVNTEGVLVIPCQFGYASDFSEGVCVVSNEEGFDGYIDTSGTIVVPYQFDCADIFVDGLAEVGKNGVGGLMTRDFQIISGIKEPVTLP